MFYFRENKQILCGTDFSVCSLKYLTKKQNKKIFLFYVFVSCLKNAVNRFKMALRKILKEGTPSIFLGPRLVNRSDLYLQPNPTLKRPCVLSPCKKEKIKKSFKKSKKIRVWLREIKTTLPKLLLLFLSYIFNFF